MLWFCANSASAEAQSHCDAPLLIAPHLPRMIYDAHTRHSLGSTPGPTDCSTQLQPPQLDSAAICRSRSLCPQACRQSNDAECPYTTWNGLTTQSRHQPRYFTCPAASNGALLALTTRPSAVFSPTSSRNSSFRCVLFSRSPEPLALVPTFLLLESDLLDSNHHFGQSHHLRKVPGSLFLQTFYIACSHRFGCSVFHRASPQIYHQLADTIRPLKLQ